MSSALPKPVVIEDVVPPKCVSCKRLVSPDEKGVSFSCPNCGKYIIWRCAKCRKQGVTYQCPICGFEGP